MFRNGLKKLTRVWHPDVHHRFDEKLCYFLIAVKPYDEKAFKRNLAALLSHYGVPQDGYCIYELLGSFDFLLRVWLLRGYRADFEKRARGDDRRGGDVKSDGCIQNLGAILSFEVDASIKPWGFENDESPENLESITVEQVKAIQADSFYQAPVDLVERHIIADGAEGERKLKKPIKAFVAISAGPELYATKHGGAVIRELKSDRLLGDLSIKSHAMYQGIGFAWLLIKLVVEDYYAIGAFVAKLHENFSHHGLTTSTFLVSEKADVWSQGDGITSLALQLFEGLDTEVRDRLPELYSGSLPRDTILSIQKCAKTIIEKERKQELSPEEAQIIVDYLSAVVSQTRERVLISLFPTLGAMESDLRKPLHRAADLFFTGGKKGLYNLLNVKDPSKMPLGDVLKGWAAIILDCFKPDGQITLSPEEKLLLGAENLNSIAKMRNIVVHFGDFDPSTRMWEGWYETLIILFPVKRLLNRIINEISQYSTPIQIP